MWPPVDELVPGTLRMIVVRLKDTPVVKVDEMLNETPRLMSDASLVLGDASLTKLQATSHG